MKAARPALGFGRYAPYAQGRPRHAGGESRTEDPGRQKGDISTLEKRGYFNFALTLQ